MAIEDHPISKVRWVPREQVRPNNYNPNVVPQVELQLLQTSILADGITQPVVTYQEGPEEYSIVDGFHRWSVIGGTEAIRKSTEDMIPIVVIDKPRSERMASTVRHNRARGAHTVQGMSQLVYGMLNEGMSDAEICNALGMQPDELIRLKHVTGFALLFKDAKYSREMLSMHQIEAKGDYEQEHGPQNPDVI